jgi:hypothetical protein
MAYTPKAQRTREAETEAKAQIPGPPTPQDYNGPDGVWVGCKLPTGFVLELIPENRDSRNPPPSGPRVPLRGSSSHIRKGTGSLVVCQGTHLYGRTRVQREFWEAWHGRNAASLMVKNDLIFAEDSQRDYNAHAADTLDSRTGIEGLNSDPKKDSRLPSPLKREDEIEPSADTLRLIYANEVELEAQKGVPAEDPGNEDTTAGRGSKKARGSK